MGRVVPWSSWSEWAEVKYWLFSEDPVARRRALDRVRDTLNTFTAFICDLTPVQQNVKIAAWRARGKVPLGVESTAALLEIQLLEVAAAGTASADADAGQGGRLPPVGVPVTTQSRSTTSWQHPTSDQSLRLQYAMPLIRMVNGISDSQQRGRVASSVAVLADAAGLPPALVDLRHEATHGELPSLPLLRLGAAQALCWLRHSYWDGQAAWLEECNSQVAALITTMLGAWEASLSHQPKKRSGAPGAAPAAAMGRVGCGGGDGTVGDGAEATEEEHERLAKRLRRQQQQQLQDGGDDGEDVAELGRGWLAVESEGSQPAGDDEGQQQEQRLSRPRKHDHGRTRRKAVAELRSLVPPPWTEALVGPLLDSGCMDPPAAQSAIGNAASNTAAGAPQLPLSRVAQKKAAKAVAAAERIWQAGLLQLLRTYSQLRPLLLLGAVQRLCHLAEASSRSLGSAGSTPAAGPARFMERGAPGEDAQPKPTDTHEAAAAAAAGTAVPLPLPPPSPLVPGLTLPPPPSLQPRMDMLLGWVQRLLATRMPRALAKLHEPDAEAAGSCANGGAGGTDGDNAHLGRPLDALQLHDLLRPALTEESHNVDAPRCTVLIGNIHDTRLQAANRACDAIMCAPHLHGPAPHPLLVQRDSMQQLVTLLADALQAALASGASGVTLGLGSLNAGGGASSSAWPLSWADNKSCRALLLLAKLVAPPNVGCAAGGAGLAAAVPTMAAGGGLAQHNEQHMVAGTTGEVELLASLAARQADLLAQLRAARAGGLAGTDPTGGLAVLTAKPASDAGAVRCAPPQPAASPRPAVRGEGPAADTAHPGVMPAPAVPAPGGVAGAALAAAAAAPPRCWQRVEAWRPCAIGCLPSPLEPNGRVPELNSNLFPGSMDAHAAVQQAAVQAVATRSPPNGFCNAATLASSDQLADGVLDSSLEFARGWEENKGPPGADDMKEPSEQRDGDCGCSGAEASPEVDEGNENQGTKGKALGGLWGCGADVLRDLHSSVAFLM